jgi:VanZ family protein
MQQSTRARAPGEPRVIVWRILTLAWATYIFMMSTKGFVSGESRSMLSKGFEVLDVHTSASLLDMLNGCLRKFAHLGEYAILAGFLHPSFGGFNRSLTQRQLCVGIVVTAALYALTDEFHQWFVPGRHSSFVDCGIDIAGATLGILLVQRLADRKAL